MRFLSRQEQVTAAVTVFGAPYSVYVRAVRLALEEKRVAYRLDPVDVFAEGGLPAGYSERHPFNRIPAFEHDGFRLYEAGAITRYVDEAFGGPALQPSAPRERARVNQLIGLCDAYAYCTLVWDIYVERVSRPRQGRQPDEERIRAALPVARTCLAAVDALKGENPFLAGSEVTLADLHVAPIFAYFVQAPEAAALLAGAPGLRAWFERIEARPSMAATAYPD